MWLIGSWLLPIISAGMWLGMLLALLIVWCAEGKPDLPSMDPGQTIAYISDTGAYGMKPLFITGAVITTIFLDAGFAAERWLRHTGRLAPNTSRTQTYLSFFAVVFGLAGSAGLILLSIFDTYHHHRLHDGFLLLFIAGYILSAIFICAEYQRLGIHYRNHRILRVSFWTKLVFIIFELILAICFGVTNFVSKKNVAAIFEWLVAFVFTFYILSFLLDLLPSIKTKKHVPQGYQQGPRIEKGHENDPGYVARISGEVPERDLTNDSAGPNVDVPMTNGVGKTNHLFGRHF